MLVLICIYAVVPACYVRSPGAIMNKPEYELCTNHAWNQKVFVMTTSSRTSSRLGNEKARTLLMFQALAGCDTVSKFRRIWQEDGMGTL